MSMVKEPVQGGMMLGWGVEKRGTNIRPVSALSPCTYNLVNPTKTSKVSIIPIL